MEVNNKLLPAAQRAINFAKATRQYMQRQPSKTFVENQQITLDVPKTRFLSKIYLHVKGTFKAAHATKTDFTKATFDMYNLIRAARISINNGFNPYQLEGALLRLYNMANNYRNTDLAADSVFNTALLENVVSVGGTVNKVNYILELPITINDRDPIGIFNMSNDKLIYNISLDCGSVADMMTDTDITISDVNITITPEIETFSIPADPNSQPDYSVLKLVSSQRDVITTPGEAIIKLTPGLTYRKLILYVCTDNKWTPVTPEDIDYFQIVFNTADTPYDISADLMEYMTRKHFQGAMPKGAYVFDFSNQGIANLGGTRDYIDTERLNECWIKVRFNTVAADRYIWTVSEKLAVME